jgi:hypothetical protein
VSTRTTAIVLYGKATRANHTWPPPCYKMSWPLILAGYSLVSYFPSSCLPIYFFFSYENKHAIMMFPSYALLSGIALYASAASAATWQIDVSNSTAGLLFSPNNIVRQPIRRYIDRRADSLPSFRPPIRETPSCLDSTLRTTP